MCMFDQHSNTLSYIPDLQFVTSSTSLSGLSRWPKWPQTTDKPLGSQSDGHWLKVLACACELVFHRIEMGQTTMRMTSWPSRVLLPFVIQRSMRDLLLRLWKVLFIFSGAIMVEWKAWPRGWQFSYANQVVFHFRDYFMKKTWKARNLGVLPLANEKHWGSQKQIPLGAWFRDPKNID